jgi:subfamily B ATP-binding cassette protein MsbA
VLPGAYLVLRETDTVLGLQLAGGPIDSAELATLYALLAGTLDPIRKLSSVYSEMKRAGAASDRIFEILDKKTKVPEPESPRIAAPLTGEIRFEDVSFSYAQRESDGMVRPPALRNINLTVKAGEVVAVIGENGSGKSTLLNLLPRFMDPDQGSVQLDGVDIRHLQTCDLRCQIGLVTQETLLFDDTLLENIRYGNPDATDEQLAAAAEQAHVNPFASQLPDGFDTGVGDKGQKLSGGQRQRVSLARAIVRDPSILILDEATSAIDAQSEQLIHRVLKEFVEGRTVFIITHVINDTFLDLVTRIVVLEQGRIAAMGTHEELVDSSPVYQRLYHSSATTRAA